VSKTEFAVWTIINQGRATGSASNQSWSNLYTTIIKSITPDSISSHSIIAAETDRGEYDFTTNGHVSKKRGDVLGLHYHDSTLYTN
jgi:hypothetical protein